jgi:hypothetical protein
VAGEGHAHPAPFSPPFSLHRHSPCPARPNLSVFTAQDHRSRRRRPRPWALLRGNSDRAKLLWMRGALPSAPLVRPKPPPARPASAGYPLLAGEPWPPPFLPPACVPRHRRKTIEDPPDRGRNAAWPAWPRQPMHRPGPPGPLPSLFLFVFLSHIHLDNLPGQPKTLPRTAQWIPARFNRSKFGILLLNYD